MTNRISEYRGRKHFWWNHICCDRQGDRCTVEWGKTYGSQWRGVGPQIRGPFLSPAVSIKPQHTGNNLWTWPSNFQLSHSALGANLSHPPTTSNQAPVPLWPFDPQHIPHFDKTNLMPHMQTICIMYVLKQAQMRTHTCSDDQVPVFTLRGQWLFFSTGSKVSNKKIQYSKCTGSPAYQYII